MKVGRVEWDRDNRRHVLEDHPERRMTVEQVEDVLLSRRVGYPMRAQPFVLGAYVGRRWWGFGATRDGRLLTVVFERPAGGVLRPITAWPMSTREQRRYEAWRRARRL